MLHAISTGDNPGYIGSRYIIRIKYIQLVSTTSSKQVSSLASPHLVFVSQFFLFFFSLRLSHFFFFLFLVSFGLPSLPFLSNSNFFILIFLFSLIFFSLYHPFPVFLFQLLFPF